MRIIFLVVAIIAGVGVSLAAEPLTPYEVVRFASGKLTLGGELFKPKGKGPTNPVAISSRLHYKIITVLPGTGR